MSRLQVSDEFDKLAEELIPQMPDYVNSHGERFMRHRWQVAVAAALRKADEAGYARGVESAAVIVDVGEESGRVSSPVIARMIRALIKPEEGKGR